MTTSCGGYKCQIEGTDPFDPFDYCHNSPGFGRGYFVKICTLTPIPNIVRSLIMLVSFQGITPQLRMMRIPPESVTYVLKLHPPLPVQTPNSVNLVEMLVLADNRYFVFP